MAPGVCATSFRMFMRSRGGLRLMPVATLSSLNSWSMRDRNYCTKKWLEDTTNSGKTITKPTTKPAQGKATLGTQDFDFSKLKVSELKTHLREHGLSVSGKKDILLKRLQNYLQQQEQQQEELQYPEKQLEKMQPEEKQNHLPFIDKCNAADIDVKSPSTSCSSNMDRNASLSTGKVVLHHATFNTQLKRTPETLNAEPASRRLFDLEHLSTEEVTGDVTVEYIQGLPHLTVPLPSRNEKCRFALKPVSHKVGDLLTMLKSEDRGIDRATVLNKNGVRIASTCNIESLMDEPFWLHINDQKYQVVPPQRQKIAAEDISKLGDIRALVAQLYEALHVGEYHIEKEKELTEKLEDLKYQVTPLEQQKAELSAQAGRKTNVMTWVGLGMMSVQFGILARLTWWEYSWDIMEPVTYFVTYGTAMACYAYFCITKQDYTLPDVKDRQYLLTIHKRAKKKNFDMDQYNTLKRQIAEIEYDLKRLRDPMNLQLPTHVERSLEFPQKTPDILTSKILADNKSNIAAFRIPFFDGTKKMEN